MHQQSKSKIIKFLERDERDVLKYEQHVYDKTLTMTDAKFEDLKMKIGQNHLYDIKNLNK